MGNCESSPCLVIAVAVLGVATGFFILLSTAAIICSCCLCYKAYRFKRIRCSCKVIHCLCCSCEVKEIQPDEDHGDVAPPAAGGLPQETDSLRQYEPVTHHTQATGSLGDRHPEPLPRPPAPTTLPLPIHTDDSDDDGEDGTKPRTVSVEDNYIEFVQDANPGTRTGSMSFQMPPPPGLRESNTLMKRVSKEEVQLFGHRRRSAGIEDDEAPLLEDTFSKGGYKSTEYSPSQSTRTLPNRAGSKLARKHASALYKRPREAHDDGGGHLSPLPSSDAASSDTVSSNPAAVHALSRSLPWPA